MKARIKNLQISFNSLSTAILHIEVNKYCLNGLEAVKKPLYVKIEEIKKKRSNNSNSLLWELCQKLAEKLNIPKEDIYKQAIHEMGSCYSVEVPTPQAEQLISNWTSRGIGWLVDGMGEEAGITSLLLYPGSSVYDSKQMARLIDFILDECKEQGVELDEADYPSY